MFLYRNRVLSRKVPKQWRPWTLLPRAMVTASFSTTIFLCRTSHSPHPCLLATINAANRKLQVTSLYPVSKTIWYPRSSWLICLVARVPLSIKLIISWSPLLKSGSGFYRKSSVGPDKEDEAGTNALPLSGRPMTILIIEIQLASSKFPLRSYCLRRKFTGNNDQGITGLLGETVIHLSSISRPLLVGKETGFTVCQMVIIILRRSISKFRRLSRIITLICLNPKNPADLTLRWLRT